MLGVGGCWSTYTVVSGLIQNFERKLLKSTCTPHYTLIDKNSKKEFYKIKEKIANVEKERLKFYGK